MSQLRIAFALLALALAGAASPPAAVAKPQVTTPNWARDAVFYQIFPERFANGDRRNDPPGTEPWGSTPKPENYMGGDLEGVRQKLPYLQALGVNAIYFNPLFTSDSNHKYHTVDYMHVDPAFGGDRAFDALLKDAHARGIKVLLDGVFNHSGDTHPFFLDAVAKGPQSKYWSWYKFHGFPVVKTPKPNYEAWWGMAALPQLQVAKNRTVADYVFQVEEHWLKRGIDGWRLDVPNEIDSDAFWREFRERAKRVNPEAYIVGEIWDPADRWLQGDQFDSVMNYQWRDAVLKFVATRELDADAFATRTTALRQQYDPAITDVMFNLLGSHDTERFLTLAGGEANRLKLAVTCQMTYPGAPVIYYGDEIGMQGGKDPDDRRCFEWDAARQDRGLLTHYQRLIALRKRHRALRAGPMHVLGAQAEVLAYMRGAGKDGAVVALNAGPKIRELAVHVGGRLPDGLVLVDALSGRSAQVVGGKLALRLDPLQGMVLLPAGR